MSTKTAIEITSLYGHILNYTQMDIEVLLEFDADLPQKWKTRLQGMPPLTLLEFIESDKEAVKDGLGVATDTPGMPATVYYVVCSEESKSVRDRVAARRIDGLIGPMVENLASFEPTAAEARAAFIAAGPGVHDGREVIEGLIGDYVEACAAAGIPAAIDSFMGIAGTGDILYMRELLPPEQQPPLPRDMPRPSPRSKKYAPTQPGGCSRKHCRLGDRECDQYWGCRDTCRVADERITAMDTCPQPEG